MKLSATKVAIERVGHCEEEAINGSSTATLSLV